MVIVLVMALVTILIVASSYSSQARDKIRSIGEEICSELDETSLEEEELSKYLFGIESTDYVKIYIIPADYESEGDEIFISKMAGEDDISSIFSDALDQFDSFGASSPVMYASDNGTLSYCAYSDYAGGSYVILNYSLVIANRTTRTLQTYIIVMCIIVMLAAFVISYFMSNRLSNPINSITASANEMAKGNYNVKFASAQYSEVAQLSDTLNYVTGEIKKSDDFQKQLLANVSHDLKTPLTMIKAYASMIKEISGDDPEKREKHLDIIINETDRLTSMINDVLAVSKAEADTQLNIKIFNLTDYLYGIIDKFSYLQDTQGYNIMVDIDEGVYTQADEEKMGQVIYNLVSNAVNYTGADKTIYVTLKDDPANSRVKLSVKDTGKGIAKEDMENIWNRFYRIQENHERPVKGTGLGLNIVKIILDSHHFDYGVDSEVGKGGVFWVDLPSVSDIPDEAK